MKEQYLYGIHAVASALQNSKRKIKKIIIQQERADKRIAEILTHAKQRKISLEFLPKAALEKKFADAKTQGVVAVADNVTELTEKGLLPFLQAQQEPTLILILDGVTDPHNLGACLRSADAAGVDLLIMPKDKNVGITPVVSKVACGAAESVPILRVTNLARIMEALKESGIWIYGAAGEASESIYTLDFRGNTALVMGSEGSGMRRLTREYCDGLFSLPMKGCVDSLNVSVATGICLYEVVRQRG